MGDYARPQDEDCLTLTIATPEADADARPVVVWLHGGAYLSGAGSLDWYDGGTLARDGDLVFVGVNYRLGALGFLCHEQLGDGNDALFDMIAALTWIRENIAAFGGDPARVTIMGQSAGAHAIMCLLAMPEAAGLFQRAILQSTPPAMAPLSRIEAIGNADRLLGALGVFSGATDIAARLRSETPARLVEAQMAAARTIARFADIAPPFVPVFDELAAPTAFLRAAAEGAGSRKVDVMIGTTREEMHAFFAPDPAMESPEPGAVAARFAGLAGSADAIEAYRTRRPGASDMDVLGDLVTDHMFLFPSLALANAVTQAGARAWVYQFDWQAPRNRFHACHCIELPFTFGTLAAWPDAAMLAGGDAAQMQALSSTMRRTWSAFAHTGDPTTDALPWPAYITPLRRTMIFGAVCGIVGDTAGVSSRDGFERWSLTA